MSIFAVGVSDFESCSANIGGSSGTVASGSRFSISISTLFSLTLLFDSGGGDNGGGGCC